MEMRLAMLFLAPFAVRGGAAVVSKLTQVCYAICVFFDCG